jgi:anti-sigma factor RsiW
MECDQMQELISAYSDGELDASQRGEAERHLATCADCTRALESLSALKTALGNETLLFNVPGALHKRIDALVNKAADPAAGVKPKPSRPILQLKWIAITMAAGLALAAGIAGYFAMWPTERQRIAADAVQDHRRSLLANHLVDIASSDPPTVLHWFGSQLSFAPMAPNQVPTGYVLVGGRVDILDSRRVAVLVYRNGSQISNIFQWPSSGEISPGSVNTIQGLGVASWNIAGMNFYAVSDGGASLAAAISNTFMADGCSTR